MTRKPCIFDCYHVDSLIVNKYSTVNEAHLDGSGYIYLARPIFVRVTTA